MKQYTVIVAIKVSANNEQEAVPKFYKECTLKNAIKHDINIVETQHEGTLMEQIRRHNDTSAT